MRRIIFTLLILPAVLASAAQESFDVDGVTYVTTSSTTVSATGGVSTLTSLVIPETVTNGGKTYTVTDIGRGAFKDCPLTEVTLPSTLLTFGTQPFNGSNGLVITSHAVQAPMSTGGGWIATESEKCTLRVPAIAFDEYYYKWYYYQWSPNNYFGGIEYIDYEPKTIFIHSDFSFTRVPNTTPDLQLLIEPETGRLTLDKAMSFGSFSQHVNLTGSNNGNDFSSMICSDKVTASSVELDVTLNKEGWNFVTFPFDVKVSDIATNNVLRQQYKGKDIPSGRKLETESKIDLVLGLNGADAMTYVPNLHGYKYLRAVDALHDNSLNVSGLFFDKSVRTYNDSLNAVVYSQRPSATGYPTVMGTGVTLYLSVDGKPSAD